MGIGDRKKSRNNKYYEKCVINYNSEQAPTVDVVPCSGTILFISLKKQDCHDFYLLPHTILLLLCSCLEPGVMV